MKSKATISLIIFWISIWTSLNGQRAANLEQEIQNKFAAYCKAVPKEEIYIHTDREDYIAGEILWYSIYLIDRQTNLPSLLSDIAYFELLSSDNKPIIRRKTPVSGGFASGAINIPDTLTSGTFTIRAYTSWMKNFLPSGCFVKNINIVNAISPGNIFSRSAIQDRLAGMSTVSGSAGRSSPDVTLRVESRDEDFLNVVITANQGFISANKNQCFIFIQTHGIKNMISGVMVTGERTVFSVQRRLLIPGINQITLFDSGGRPVAERYNYTPRSKSEGFSLVSPDSCASRSWIPASIKSGAGPGSDTDISKLSISVVPQTSYAMFEDMADYMVLGSEYGFIPDEIRYAGLDSLTPEKLEQFLSTIRSNWINWDIIMSGSRPKLMYEAEKQEHFIYGSLVNSTTLQPDTGQYVFLSIPSKVANFQYSRSDRNGRFRFTIPISEERRDIIIRPELSDRNNKIIIESAFSEVYSSDSKTSLPTEKDIPLFVSEWGANYQVSKIYEVNGSVDARAPDFQIPSSTRFYGKPDIELVMDDYIKLPVMEEVFFELMPGTFMRKKRTGYEITIADISDHKVFDHPPLLMIDGVVINNPDIIANLDPETVEKIDAVKEKYFVGEYMIYGIINVITRDGDFSSVTLPSYAVRLNYRSIDPGIAFSSPDYSSEDMRKRRIPDLRNTLYWNPSVKPGLDGNIEAGFWASDYAGDYIIAVQGMKSDGSLIAIKKKISIY